MATEAGAGASSDTAAPHEAPAAHVSGGMRTPAAAVAAIATTSSSTVAEAAAASGGAPRLKDFREAGAHDNHPFFSYYGMLVHQQNMMQDMVRTTAYRDAFMANAADFAGKVVMDVGTGSGILAYFAVCAGAKKVYAVEASNVADRARTLMAANGYDDRIVVIKKRVEEVVLPEGEKVDIIISEPMGFMLIHERMLESYIIARTMFLKPGGRMFPTTGTIYCAPFTDQTLWNEQSAKVSFWHTTDFYGLDLTSLVDAATADHFSQPVVGFVDPTSLLSSTTCEMTIDFLRDAPESLHEMVLPFEFTVTKTALCHGLACWFDVLFDGTTSKFVFSTGPSAPGTHWYQCRLLLPAPLAVNAHQRVAGTLHMTANEKYSYNLVLKMHLPGSEASTADGSGVTSSVAVNLQDQMYHYLNSAPASGTTS